MVPVNDMREMENVMDNFTEKRWSTKEKFFLLVSGVVLTILSGYRWGVEVIAWVSWIPFLMYGMKTKGWKDSLLLFIALQVGINGVTAKIISEPIPLIFAFLFGVPTGFSAWILLSLWEQVRRRVSFLLWIPSFVTLVIISEWTTFEYSDFGMWGTMAGTQVNNLELLQLVSVTGMSGIAALMAFVAVLASLLLVDYNKKRWLSSLIFISTIFLIIMIFGSVRVYNQQTKNTVKAAAITTDLHLTPSSIPGKDELKDGTNELFQRNKQAVGSGAKLIVWNEGATLVEKEDEKELINRGQEFSKNNSVDFVMAYIVPLSKNPLKYDNKYVWFSNTGEILETYRKHHPVPSEAAIKGTEDLIVHEREWGRAAGAICYDYDFPEMAREHGKLKAGIVAVPSSDWFGIDPYHTKMTRIRAIEGGYSVIRPVRWATSMAFDGYGRVRAAMPYNEGNRVMIVDLPTDNIETIYSKWGDWLVIPSILFWLLLASIIIRKRMDKNSIR